MSGNHSQLHLYTEFYANAIKRQLSFIGGCKVQTAFFPNCENDIRFSALNETLCTNWIEMESLCSDWIIVSTAYNIPVAESKASSGFLSKGRIRDDYLGSSFLDELKH